MRGATRPSDKTVRRHQLALTWATRPFVKQVCDKADEWRIFPAAVAVGRGVGFDPVRDLCHVNPRSSRLGGTAAIAISPVRSNRSHIRCRPTFNRLSG